MNSLAIEADTAKLAEVISFVNAILEENEASVKAQTQVDIAVEEIFVNVAQYAYAPGTGLLTMQVNMIADPKTIKIVFIDEGKEYNPLERPDPDITLSAEDRQIGGLGIYMAQKFVDYMYYVYQDGHNILTIEKHI